MKVCIVTPAPLGTNSGNRVTALRWRELLCELGHDAVVVEAYEGRSCDVLVALHARRSAPSIARFRSMQPDAPLVVALTGTDLYGDLDNSPSARRSVELASRIVVLQRLGLEQVPPALRSRVRVIEQSVKPIPPAQPRDDVFEVVLLAHLRSVKDPFIAAQAVRDLPEESRIQVVHAGGEIEPGMADRARAESERNPRYAWVGELPRGEALRILARSRLLVLTSRLEGGANVVSEALAASVPVVSTRISGSIGLLGEDYPGYFPVGDPRALRHLLSRIERDGAFRTTLRTWVEGLRWLVDPARERERWGSLLTEITDAGLSFHPRTRPGGHDSGTSPQATGGWDSK
ncbi:MAG: selenoneine biosynthesis selenosugar synthase SenB [Nitriliruptorales bacterium]